MADNVLSTWQVFLYEMQGLVQETFPSEAVLLGELSGYDARSNTIDRASAVHRITRAEDLAAGRDRFGGKFVRHPVILAGLTGGGPVSESSTWNVPHTLQDTEAHINLVRSLWPISLSVDVERDSSVSDVSARTAVAELTKQASQALARQENLMINGDGTGKVSDITNASTGLTIQLSTTGLAPMDLILPGTVWDIRTKSNGTTATNGIGRLVTSVSDTPGGTQTVTFDTNAFGPGNSGSITWTTNEGIFIHDDASPTQAGFTAANAGTYVAQGVEQVAAITGTFENIAKGTVTQWQGTDGRQGVTTTVPLSSQLLNQAVRVGRRSGRGWWDLIMGDPAVIDLYKDSLMSSVRYQESTITLKSGFSGIVYDGADKPIVCIKEPLAKKGAVKFIAKEDLVIYGDSIGPKFLDDDGAMFRRFNRTLAKEADLLDRWNLGAKKCNTMVFLNNLQQAVV